MDQCYAAAVKSGLTALLSALLVAAWAAEAQRSPLAVN